MSPVNMKRNMPAGHVEIRYLIDSNGVIFNPEIIESVPEGVWDKFGMKAIQQMEYQAAEANAANTPVYVSTIFNFG